MYAQTDAGTMISMPVHVVIRFYYPCSVNMVMMVMIVVVPMLAMTSIAVPFFMPAFFHMAFM